jgi:hypothetical protein
MAAWFRLALRVVIVALLAAPAFLAWPAAAPATTLQPLSVPQLSRHAVSVVAGTVVSTRVRQIHAGVRTEVRLRVSRSFKGVRRRFMTVQVPGGLLPDGTRVVVSGMPAFSVGERCVVFLDIYGWVVGGFQGELDVGGGRVEATGESLGAFGRRVQSAIHGRSVPAPRSLRPSARTLGGVTISSITPSSASAGTGSYVTIAGSGFGSTRGSVLFTYGRNGTRTIASTAIRSWSDTSITCLVPTDSIDNYDASAGSGPVVVATALGAQSNGYAFSVPFGYGAAKWTRTSVTYRVNTSGIDDSLRRSLVDAGAGMWNALGTHFSFSDGGSTTAGLGNDGLNVISWASGMPYGVLAATYSFVSAGTVKEMDIEFSNSFAWGDGAPGSNTYDIQGIASHEMGHWLVLLDLYGDGDSQKIMYGYGDQNEQRRAASAGDILGIEWIYGGGVTPTPTPTPTVSPTPTPTPSPGDLGPVCRAKNASVRRGAICKIEYVVTDDIDLVVARSITITTPGGTVKKRWVGVTHSSTAWQSFRFRCDLGKGSYRIVVDAQDLAGHPARVVGRASLTVR